MGRAVSEFRRIPGVGKSIADDFNDLGYTKVDDLIGLDPEQLYLDLCKYKGCHVDRCMLYVFRCSVYFAEGGSDHEKLKWWNWKD